MASPKQLSRDPEERKEHMLVRREFASEQAQYLVLALHDAGISTCWIESVQIGEEDYHARVIIDRDEMSWKELAKVHAVADEHRAKVSLGEVRMNQQSHSRFVLWPLHEED